MQIKMNYLRTLIFFEIVWRQFNIYPFITIIKKVENIFTNCAVKYSLFK